MRRLARAFPSGAGPRTTGQRSKGVRRPSSADRVIVSIVAQPTDPARELQALENSLRLVIRSVLGDSWETTAGLNTTQIAQRQSDDQQSRRGAIVEDDRLAYTNFYDLHTIIGKRWAEGFKPIFGDKRRFDVYLETLEGLRNVVAHNRSFLPYEMNLISGISGRLRNQVTLYRSSQDPVSQFYPVIESVVDHLGQSGSPTVPRGPYSGSAQPGTRFDSSLVTRSPLPARARTLVAATWNGLSGRDQ